MLARRTATRILGGVVLLLSAGTAAGAAPTAAAEAPAPVVDAVAEPMWQTGDAVWAVATGGGRVFAGGDFTTTRPPGVAPGGPGEVVRKHLAAYDAATGALDPGFAHAVSGQVSAIALSPDASRLYIGGEFGTVDDQPRPRLAAFDLTRPGAPLLPFSPAVGNGFVKALAVTADTVYAGGTFTTVGGVSRGRLAAFTVAGALRTGWSATVDDTVNTLLVAPSRDRVIAGGGFSTADGVAHRALASFDAATGSLLPMSPTLIPTCTTPGCTQHSDVKTLATDGSRVFAGAEGTGPRVFDGTLALDPATGQQVWRSNCLGATQGVTALRGVLYVGSHAHDCSAIGGFPQTPYIGGPATWHHLTAEATTTGLPVEWYPTTNAGPNDGRVANEVGPRAMANDGASVFTAGQFTTVNGLAQQGLARFGTGVDASPPTAVTGLTASSAGPGTVVLRWAAAHDPDDAALTHRVYRDGALVATLGPLTTHFWTAPQEVFRDTAAVAGTHDYAVEAVDAHGNAGPRTARAVTTATRSLDTYPAAVLNDAPQRFWRLQDISTTTATDATGAGQTGTYRGVQSQGRPGPWPGTGAVALGPGIVTTNGAPVQAPAQESIELWFRTTTTTGGRIAGWGNALTGASASYDRQLYLAEGGQLLFGVWNGKANVLWTPKAYNDGTWHQVVAEHGPAGMAMYVDGVAVAARRGSPPVTTAAAYTGLFRLGADSLAGWPQAPASTTFAGDVADLALYGLALTEDRVQAHRRLAG